MPIVGVRDAPDVLAVIPTLGEDIARLTRCVESVASGTGALRVAVLCVVNRSGGSPVELVGATVEVAGINLGWAGGLVFGASLADAPLIWAVQDDLEVDPDTLTQLAAALEEEPSLGAAGPVAVDDAGLVVPYSCGAHVAPDGVISGWYPRTATPVDELVGLGELGYLPSRGMLVRRTAFTAAGGPNVRLYPAQFVDVDFSFRLVAAGWGFRLVPRARVRHEGRGSTPLGFAEFLYSRNAQTFRHAWFPDAVGGDERFVATAALRPDPVGAPRYPLHPALSAELVEAVAQSAADALTHLGRVYTVARREGAVVSRELADATLARDAALEHAQALTRTWSWRLTAPLRWVRRGLSRLRGA